MRYIILVLVSIGLAAATQPAHASDIKTFYKRDLQRGWNVTGRFPTDVRNGSCVAELDYADQDGSYAQIVKDLSDQEIFIGVHNTDWQITDAPTTGPIQLNSYNSRKQIIRSGKLTATATDKNTVLIRHLESAEIVDVLNNASRITLIMPGNLMNTDIILVPGILDGLLECIKASLRLNVPKKPAKGETL